MTDPTVFKGTMEEGRDLVNALASHCSCVFGMMGVRLSTCSLHKALVEDQRFLDGLLCERRRRESLLSEEGQDDL